MAERASCFENLLHTVVKRIDVLEGKVSRILNCTTVTKTTHLDVHAVSFGSFKSEFSCFKSLDSNEAPILSLAQLCSQLHELEIEKDINGSLGDLQIK